LVSEPSLNALQRLLIVQLVMTTLRQGRSNVLLSTIGVVAGTDVAIRDAHALTSRPMSMPSLLLFARAGDANTVD